MLRAPGVVRIVGPGEEHEMRVVIAAMWLVYQIIELGGKIVEVQLGLREFTYTWTDLGRDLRRLPSSVVTAVRELRDL
jgi:hypothetical protein